jgi:hypothetical protein
MIHLKEKPGVWTAEREREERQLLDYEDWLNYSSLERYSSYGQRHA